MSVLIPITQQADRAVHVARSAFLHQAFKLASLLVEHEKDTDGGTPWIPRDPLWAAALAYRLAPLFEENRRNLLKAAEIPGPADCPLYQEARRLREVESHAAQIRKHVRLLGGLTAPSFRASGERRRQ